MKYNWYMRYKKMIIVQYYIINMVIMANIINVDDRFKYEKMVLKTIKIVKKIKNKK